MLTITDNDNSMFLNEIAAMFQNDSDFQQNVITNFNTDEDTCNDMQLGNPFDVRWAQNVHAVRICRVRHDLGDNVYCELDYWLCRFDDHYVIAECAADQHYSTCCRSVGGTLPFVIVPLAA